MNHLWAVIMSSVDLSDLTGFEFRPDLAGLLMRYSAAVRYTELRDGAGPVTLDVAPLDLSVEDHATNAVLAVQRSDLALDLLDDILTVELLTSRAVLSGVVSAGGVVAPAVARVLEELASIDSELPAEPSADVVHAAVKTHLYDRLLPSAEAAIEASAPN